MEHGHEVHVGAVAEGDERPEAEGLGDVDVEGLVGGVVGWWGRLVEGEGFGLGGLGDGGYRCC